MQVKRSTCCFLIAATVLACTGCSPVPGVNTTAGKTEAAAAQLAPGMTRDQIVRLLGPPNGFLTQRNSVECLIYTDRDTSTVAWPNPYMTIGRERVVVLKDGRLSQHQLVNTGVAPNVAMQMPGAPASTDICAQAAARLAGPLS